MICGDSLTSDIRGGNLAGVDTCWYNPQGDSGRADIQPKYKCKVNSFGKLYK